MEGEREIPPAQAGPDSADVALAGLRSRLAEMRMQVLRLRASRRTLMALLDLESRRRCAAEARLERLRAHLRRERRGRRARVAAGGDGQ